MARDGFETDPKPMGNLLGGMSFADQTEDSQFSKRRNALGRFFHTIAGSLRKKSGQQVRL
jgi:hypothetical protein